MTNGGNFHLIDPAGMIQPQIDHTGSLTPPERKLVGHFL